MEVQIPVGWILVLGLAFGFGYIAGLVDGLVGEVSLALLRRLVR